MELCVRDGDRLSFVTPPWSALPQQEHTLRSGEPNVVYAHNGQQLAIPKPHEVELYHCDEHGYTLSHTLKRANVQLVIFSPNNYFLLTYDRKTLSNQTENLNVWLTSSGEHVIGWHQSKEMTRDNLAAQFASNDKALMHQVNNEIQCFDLSSLFDGDNIKIRSSNDEPIRLSITGRVRHANAISFALSPCVTSSGMYQLAAFNAVKGAEPARVSVYQFSLNQTTETSIVSKSVFKAEEAVIRWNSTGDALLVSTQTATDSSGKSYYGESHLTFLRADGSVSKPIQVDANPGPVQDFTFSPNGREFLVVQGYQPATSVLYDSKTGDALRQYGRGPRNTIRYSPHGRFLMIGGFGNLNGEMDFYDTLKFRLIGSAQDRDGAKSYEWTPDSRAFVTAVLRPWRRVENGYKIWSYAGELIKHVKIEQLYQVEIRPPSSTSLYPGQPPSPRLKDKAKSMGSDKADKPPAKVAYVPPHLRGSGATAAVNRGSAAIENERKEGGGMKKLNTKPKAPMTPEDKAAAIAVQKAAEEKKRLAKEAQLQAEEQLKLQEMENTREGCEKLLYKATKKLTAVQALQQQAANNVKLTPEQQVKLAKADEFAADVTRLTAKMAALQ